MSAPNHFLNHLGGRLRPDERPGIGVPMIAVLLKVAHERPRRAERAEPDRAARQDAKPGFHQIELGGARLVESQLDPPGGGDPSVH